MDYQDHVKTQFSKEELLTIASLLGLENRNEMEIHVLVDQIRIAILEGVSFSSDLIDEFINTIRLYDEPEEFTETPHCFGFAYDYSQQCTYCLAYSKCGEKLVENLPSCFGILFSPDSDDCTQCMVKHYCKVTLPKVEVIEDTYEVYLFQDIPLVSNMLTMLGRYRSVRNNWPEEVHSHKLNRFRSFTIRGLKWVDTYFHVLKDAVYLIGSMGEPPVERKPVIYDATRKPLLKEGSYPIRLTWEFSPSKDEPS